LKESSKPQLKQLVERLPLEKFIPVTILVFLLFFIILSLITYNNIELYRKSLESVEQSNTSLRNSDKFSLILSQLQLQRRSYIVKNDNKYLAEYERLKRELDTEFRKFKGLSNKNKEVLEMIERADTLSDMVISLLDSSIVLFEKEKKITPQQTEIALHSQEYLDSMYNLMETLKEEEYKLLELNQSESKRNLGNTQLFIISTSLFAFLLLGISLYIATKLINNKNAAEKLLKKSYDEMEDRVEERTLELKHTNENLLQEINTRIAIEHSLRESESRFKEMADSAPQLIWMAGPDKLCYYFNKGWLDFTGKTLEQESGNGWRKGIHPEDLEKCMGIYTTCFDKKENFEMEFRLRTEEGLYRWVLDKGVPRYVNKEFAGYIGVCVDIHDKKRNERYLKIQYAVSKTLAEAKNTEEALKEVLKNICTGVNWKFGIAWVVEENKLVQKALWSEDKSEGDAYLQSFDTATDFKPGIGLPGRVWKQKRSAWIQNLENDDNLPHKQQLLKLGWRSAFAIPITDAGNVISVIECFNKSEISSKQDLLEVLESVGGQIGNFLVRKKAEEKLKESYDDLEKRVTERTMELAKTLNRLMDEISFKEKLQNKLKLFAHAIKDIKECVYITNLENKTLFVNSAFESLYGVVEEEIIGKDIPVLYNEKVSGNKRDEILSDSLRQGWKGEITNVLSCGKTFHLNLSTSVVRNDEGKVEAIVGIAQDITVLKENEELILKRSGLVKLLNDVILVANRSFDVAASVSYAINKMCEYTSWDVGHCFFVSGDKLVSSGIWNGNLSTRYLEVKNLTAKTEFRKNEGMPGKCFATSESYWVKLDELKSDPQYIRAKQSIAAGLNTGIWVPVIAQKEVAGVLEFFHRDDKPLDNEIFDCIKNIGIELGSMMDRKNFLELISEREKHFKAVADTANESIITVNNSGEIIYANESVETTFGYTPDELINKELTLLMPDKYVSRHTKAFKKRTSSAESSLIGKTVELEGKTKNGLVFPIELSLAEWEMNGEKYFTGMIRDISLRKQIENELIDKQKKLEVSQKIAKLGSWEWDVLNDYVSWSDEMFSIYEIKPEEFKSNLRGFLERLHPDDVDEIRKHVEGAIAEKRSFGFFERIITPEGKIKTLRSQGEVVTNDKGDVVKLIGTCLDVTEAKLAEERIRESESRLKEAQRIAKLGSWEWITDTDTVNWSEEMYEIFEIEHGTLITNELYLSMVTEEGRLERDNVIRKAIEENKPFNYHLKINTPTGKIKILNSQGKVIVDENKNIKRMVGTVVDVTEVKTAEDNLRKSEERFRLLVENVKQYAIIFLDTEGNISSWNLGAEQINGYKENEVLGKHVSIFYPEQAIKAKEPEKTLELTKKFGKVEKEGIRIRKDGSTYWADIVYTSLFDEHNNHIGFIKITRDITERKQIEESIRKSEKSLKNAQEIAKLGSWEMDLETGKITWSDEMYNLFDVDKSLGPQEYSYLKQFIYEEDREVADRLVSMLESNPENVELDYRIVTPEGRLKYLNVDIRVGKDKKGKPVKLYGSMQDITDIKLVEEELRKANQKLLEAQKELIHNEKLAALGRFSSGIAHEIRNPLANISALAQLVSKSNIEDEKTRKHLKYILLNSDIANRIIKDLLNFASPGDLVFKPENLAEIIDNILNSIEPRCLESKIFLTKQLPQEMTELMLDKVKFENAILNFLSNAIDAMPDGGNLAVKVRTEFVTNEVVIDIIDSGEGISPENLDKIFEPFFTTKETGTGLGLGLAYQTIKSHFGILNIYSEPEKGTHIEIKLPIQK
jgi:PAS domain S-box-containing protein